MEEEDVDLVWFPGPGGQGAEFAFPPCEPVSAFSEVLFQQPCNGPRRPFPAAVRGRPLDFSLVLLSLKAEGRQVNLVLLGIAPLVPEHVIAVALDGHVESAAAAFGARRLGQPHLVWFRCSSERAVRHQEVLGIFARTLCKCVSQDVPTINQRPNLHVCVPLRGIRNDDAKGEAKLLISHRTIVECPGTGRRANSHRPRRRDRHSVGGPRHQEDVAGRRPRPSDVTQQVSTTWQALILDTLVLCSGRHVVDPVPLGMLDPADSRVDVHIEQIRDRGRRHVNGGGGGLTRPDARPGRLRARRATSPERVRASRLR